MSTEPERGPRRRFQFSLKTLLAMTLVAGGACGWTSLCFHQRLRQFAAASRLNDLGGHLDFGAGFVPTPAFASTRTGVSRVVRASRAPFDPPGPGDWLSNVLGAPKPAPVRAVDFFGALTDADMPHVATLADSLVRLSLVYTQVTDDGLKHLAGLNRLTSLSLSHSPVSDAGLRHLHSLTALEDIWLQGTDVTAAGADELRRALPHCRVHGR